MKKKLLSMALAAAMLLNTAPITAITAFAADSGEPTVGQSQTVCVEGCTLPQGHEGDCVTEPADPTCTCEAADGEPHDKGCALYVAPTEPSCTCGAVEGAPHAENCALYQAPAELVCSQLEGCTGDTHAEGCALYVAPTELSCTCGAAEGEPHAEDCALYQAPANPVCTCETDDESKHATDCPVYIAPENPECHCVVKCTEANVWCDVCGFDYTACTGEGAAAFYENKTTLTEWPEGDITLAAGETLDLSELTSGPETTKTKWIYVTGNEATIIGNPEVTFQNVSVLFNFGTRNDVYKGDANLSIENLKITGSISLKQYTEPTSTTISYSGDCAFAGGFGSSNYKSPITYEAAEGATLTLGKDNGYYHDVTFNGGTVNVVPVGDSSTSTSLSTKEGNITVKDCTMTFESLSYYQSGWGTYPRSALSSSGNIVIDNSIIYAEHPDITYAKERSAIVAAGDITIKNGSEVTATGTVTSVGSAGNGMYGAPAIQSDGNITIDCSEVTAYIRRQTHSTCNGGNSAAIGGKTCKSITIIGSTVNAQGYYGAGIGKGGSQDNSGYNGSDATYSASNPAITIEDSNVYASSYYGAGIGSGWTRAKSCTSVSDITIKGDSEVIASSVYGAGIGAGSQGTATTWNGVQIEIGDVTVGGWGEGGSDNGEATAYSRMRAAAASADDSDSLSVASKENTLAVNTGKLTIEGSPAITAESGVKAVSLSVTASAPMMEYTLVSKNSSGTYMTTTPTVKTAVNRTDSTDTVSSYDLRPGFASLAFYPVAAGDYSLSFGSGAEPAVLLDVTADAPTYARTYPVSGSSLNSFKVTPATKISGTASVSNSDGTLTVTPSLTPSDATVSYQWYCNDTAIENTNSKTYITNADGAYYCVMEGTGLYYGTIKSNVVTVGSVPTVLAPKVTNPAAQISDTSITLDTVSGYEYGIYDGTDIKWQDSPSFTGLKRNTEYTFVQRVKGSTAVSSNAAFKTAIGKPGADVITYDYEKETIKIPNGITVYTDSDYMSTLSNGASVTGYIGKTVYIAYSDTELKDESTVAAVDVPARPAAPVISGQDIQAVAEGIRIVTADRAVYKLYTSATYDDPNPASITGDGTAQVFTNLGYDTLYRIRAYYPATNNSFCSEAEKYSIRTLKQDEKAVVVIPGRNIYPYDGQQHAFSYTTEPSGLTGFTIEYYQGGDWSKATATPPADVGIYNVIVTREADGEYVRYGVTFANALEIVQMESRVQQDTLTKEHIQNTDLANTKFNTVETIKAEMTRILTSGTGYSENNVAHYDVRLQFSRDGENWIDATEENFPANGITVVLPYPDGTAKNTHDFKVTHMFTTTSTRLGTKAGETETPAVTKLANDIQVTFKGLSPVSIAWKAASKGGSSSDSSSSYRDDEYDFWKQVQEKIKDAGQGSTITVNAGWRDRMTASVMAELLGRGDITLVINWTGGKQIIIPAGKALDERNRIYYPLSYLENYDFGSIDPAKLNPETGGYTVIDAPAIPAPVVDAAGKPEVTDPQRGLAATIEDAQKGIEQTIPGVFEPEVGTTPEKSNGGFNVGWVLLAVLAAGAGFWFFWKRKKEKNAA